MAKKKKAGVLMPGYGGYNPYTSYGGGGGGADTSNQPDWAGSGSGGGGGGPPGQPSSGPHIGYGPTPTPSGPSGPSGPPPGQPTTGPHIGYGGSPPSGGSGLPGGGPSGPGGGGIIDVAAVQDAIDDAAAIAAAGPGTYIHYNQIYGPGQAIPGQTGYAFTNVNPNSNIYQSLQGMDPNTLAFFGYTPGSSSVPNELLNMVAQGSIVSGNEAVTSNEPYITTWSNLEDLTQQAQGGNQAAIDALSQTLFPGGLTDYNDITGLPNVIPITGGSDGGGGGGWGWGGYGGDRWPYGGDRWYAAQKALSDANAANVYTPQAELQQAMISQHRKGAGFRKSRGGIVSLLGLRS